MSTKFFITMRGGPTSGNQFISKAHTYLRQCKTMTKLISSLTLGIELATGNIEVKSTLRVFDLSATQQGGIYDKQYIARWNS